MSKCLVRETTILEEHTEMKIECLTLQPNAEYYNEILSLRKERRNTTEEEKKRIDEKIRQISERCVANDKMFE